MLVTFRCHVWVSKTLQLQNKSNSTARSSSETIHVLGKVFNRHEPTSADLAQLRQHLGSFVAKHSDPDDTPSTRVQEELRRICNETLGTDPSKLEAFILALTLLLPYLRRIGELDPWFEVVLSFVVDALESRKSSVQQMHDFVLASVAYDNDATDSQERSKACQALMSKLIQEYLKRTAALSKGSVMTTVRSQNRVQQQLQDLVALVGRSKPQDLFTAFEAPIQAQTPRFHALQLLCTWLKHQHPHLDVVAHTAVVDILLKCLMNDRSAVMISVALQCVLMLLPHIPVTVASQLPRLFLIYSRCLCWEKFTASSSKAQRDLVTDDRVRSESDDEDDPLFSIDPGWSVVDSVPDTPEVSAPELLSYFTFLYGLYPLNFTSYIRKPRKYLKQIDFPGAEHFDLDQAVIRSRTEQYQRAHLLHPNFFNMTAEEELADNRWIKAEPSEVSAECLGLYSGSHTPVRPADLTSTSIFPAATESMAASGLQSMDSIVTSSVGAESPTALSPTYSGSSSLGPRPSQTLSSDAVFLQRELMALRNELTFERYLKQQHALAIGQLKKDMVKEVAAEAETATLINMNRSLARKLTEANNFNERLQKETQSRKAHARQSEDQLNAKLRALRATLADQQAQEASLTQAHADIEALRELVVASEARELSAREAAEKLRGDVAAMATRRNTDADEETPVTARLTTARHTVWFRCAARFTPRLSAAGYRPGHVSRYTLGPLIDWR